MKKNLSILVPTYNRIISLKNNIKKLENIITNLNIQKYVKVIISDNFSEDHTYLEIKKIIRTLNIDVELYQQIENIGLEKNALFTLKKSKSDFSMFLGDDDYISEEFLHKVFQYIQNSEVTCILPNFYPINKNFQKLGETRDKIVCK